MRISASGIRSRRRRTQTRKKLRQSRPLFVSAKDPNSSKFRSVELKPKVGVIMVNLDDWSTRQFLNFSSKEYPLTGWRFEYDLNVPRTDISLCARAVRGQDVEKLPRTALVCKIQNLPGALSISGNSTEVAVILVVSRDQLHEIREFSDQTLRSIDGLVLLHKEESTSESTLRTESPEFLDIFTPNAFVMIEDNGKSLEAILAFAKSVLQNKVAWEKLGSEADRQWWVGGRNIDEACSSIDRIVQDHACRTLQREINNMTGVTDIVLCNKRGHELRPSEMLKPENYSIYIRGQHILLSPFAAAQSIKSLYLALIALPKIPLRVSLCNCKIEL